MAAAGAVGTSQDKIQTRVPQCGKTFPMLSHKAAVQCNTIALWKAYRTVLVLIVPSAHRKLNWRVNLPVLHVVSHEQTLVNDCAKVH